jgi:hypothetical protein
MSPPLYLRISTGRSSAFAAELPDHRAPGGHDPSTSAACDEATNIADPLTDGPGRGTLKSPIQTSRSKESRYGQSERKRNFGGAAGRRVLLNGVERPSLGLVPKWTR